MRALLEAYWGGEGKPEEVAHDGRKNAWSPFVLVIGSEALDRDRKCVTKEVSHPWNGYLWSVKVTCARGMEVDVGKNGAKALETALHMHAFNRRAKGQAWFTRGRTIFPPQAGDVAEIMHLGDARVAVRGWHQALRQCQRGTAIILDAAFSAFAEVARVPTLMAMLVGYKAPEEMDSDLRKGRGPRRDDLYERLQPLTRFRIIADHFKNQDGRPYVRRYTIGTFSDPPTTAIAHDEVTVKDHFWQRWGIDLEYPHLPTLQTKGGKSILLPPEVCRIPDGQRQDKSLTGEQTNKILQMAKREPAERVNATLYTREGDKLIEAINNDPTVSRFGLNFSSRMTNVDSRVLPQPEVLYTRGKSYTPGDLKFEVRAISCLFLLCAFAADENGRFRASGPRRKRKCLCAWGRT